MAAVNLAGLTTTTNPSIANTTSVQVLAEDAYRKYLLIQNNSPSTIAVSFRGATLTSVTPSTSNPCHQIVAGGFYESPAHFVPQGAITIYQASGGALTTITVTVG